MVCPILHRSALAGQGIDLALDEGAERLARQVVIDLAALGEIHRGIQRIVGIALIAEAILEDEIEHSGPVGIGIGPDIGAGAQEAVGATLGKGAVGEQGRGNGLQCQRGAELHHHVGLGLKVQIGLDGRGAQHHVQAQPALLGHIGAHNVVAALGHDRDFLARPQGVEADAQEAQVQLIRDLLDLHQVLAGFRTDVVDRLQRGTRQFELSARFQADRG